MTGGGTGLGKGMSMKFSSLGAKVRVLPNSLPTDVNPQPSEHLTCAGGNCQPTIAGA